MPKKYKTPKSVKLSVTVKTANDEWHKKAAHLETFLWQSLPGRTRRFIELFNKYVDELCPRDLGSLREGIVVSTYGLNMSGQAQRRMRRAINESEPMLMPISFGFLRGFGIEVTHTAPHGELYEYGFKPHRVSLSRQSLSTRGTLGAWVEAHKGSEKAVINGPKGPYMMVHWKPKLSGADPLQGYIAGRAMLRARQNLDRSLSQSARQLAKKINQTWKSSQIYKEVLETGIPFEKMHGMHLAPERRFSYRRR